MAIEGRLLKQVQLDNGLTLYFRDRSRSVAGNRWQVRLHIIIPVSVKQHYFSAFADPQHAFQEFTSACGDSIELTLEKVRNFVDEDEMAQILEQMQHEFLASNQAYVSNPKFAERLVVKRYAHLKESASCRALHTQAVKRADSRD